MHATSSEAGATQSSLLRGFFANFMGHAPLWYKQSILFALVLNPFVLLVFGPFVLGWVLILEFIGTLAMALKCHPLPPGGLLVLEAVMLGMVGPETSKLLMDEVTGNLPVILLLIFMVPAVAMMKELLIFVFTKMLVGIKSKTLLSLTFILMGAVLSAWLDALTVTAVIITIASGFYHIYHKVASQGDGGNHDHDVLSDVHIHDMHQADLEQFRGFLRNVAMHGAVGTAIGGVLTLVGEPQNIIIGNKMGWDFVTFFVVMAPATLPAFVCGILTCLLLERFHLFGYGVTLPASVRTIMENHVALERARATSQEHARLIVQALAACCMVLGLATHIVEVGFVGLGVLLFVASMNGHTEEHKLNHAFAESMSFTTIVVVFFVLVAIIHAQHLFAPVIGFVLAQEGESQLAWMYIANGLLSAISDNVFVALTYITELKTACDAGSLTPEACTKLAVAINTGTNLPSVATPNGQAAFLFLLMSPLASLIRLSYWRMCVMAFPYTIALSLSGLFGVMVLL
jgi:Na+:H+ antiporter, NhaB family